MLFWLSLACSSTPKYSNSENTAEVIYDLDGDGYTSEEDCDDNNPLIFPDSVEQCDGIDNNCDGEVDENVLNTYYLDQDIDGFGARDETIEACEVPSGYAAVGTDCDDQDTEVYPGAVELCDGKDNNCDELIDNGVGTLVYPDFDSDGFGDANEGQTQCVIEEGFVSQGGDCNDADPSVHLGAEEVCDGADNDCDGEIDEGAGYTLYVDADSDGYGDNEIAAIFSCTLLEGYSENNDDCNDADTEIYPFAPEKCNYIDNDCNGIADDNAIDAVLWYSDFDQDGVGDSNSVSACEPPPGYVGSTGDCDGFNNTIYPGALEVCDGMDNDCSGIIDDNPSDGSIWYLDLDSDGYGIDSDTVVSCNQPASYVASSGDCDGFNNTIHPGALEVCDEIDNDCSGTINDNPSDGVVWYADTDEDGFGDPTNTLNACSDANPEGYILLALDCDDANASIYPEADETCNSIDDNCNGAIDEEPVDGIVYYLDSDSDGYGDPLQGKLFCEPTTGYETNAEDCNDARADLFPENGFCAAGNDCLDILDAGLSVGDGTYDIDIDGSGTGVTAFPVDCDMTTDGGGWTGLSFADTYAYLSGDMSAQGTTVSESISLITGPRTLDSGSQNHYYFYEFDFPGGYSEFYLDSWFVKAYAPSGNTSEVCGAISTWSGGITSHGDIALGSPLDNGPVASMYTAAGSSGCFFSCRDCALTWPTGSQIYQVGSLSEQVRVAWGEEGPQTEGWYPWYSGSLYLR